MDIIREVQLEKQESMMRLSNPNQLGEAKMHISK